jgi:hypothetical protein
MTGRLNEYFFRQSKLIIAFEANKMTFTFFQALWNDYTKLAPQAEVIHQMFSEQNEKVINDHVAFRTFAGTPLCLDSLEPIILAMNYRLQEQYRFETKKLRARSYVHSDPSVPKIFLSELLTHELSDQAQAIIEKYTQQIAAPHLSPEIFWSGRHWDMPTWEDYQALLAESEYAAWLTAIGLRANHFTISINHLNHQNDVKSVLETIKQAGFAVNTTGGEVKGSPQVYLEQGSTMADQKVFTFGDGSEHAIPTCFYEFALRYREPSGVYFQGFVEGNADKIFDSTNVSKAM